MLIDMLVGSATAVANSVRTCVSCPSGDTGAVTIRFGEVLVGDVRDIEHAEPVFARRGIEILAAHLETTHAATVVVRFGQSTFTRLVIGMLRPDTPAGAGWSQ